MARLDTFYNGAAFYPGFEKGRSSGRISLTASGVVFEAEGFSAELPFAGLAVKLGGASNRLIFFSHPSLPELSVYTSDHSILADERLHFNRNVSSQVSGIKGKKRNNAIIAAGIAGILLALIASIFLLKDNIVKAVARRVPAGVEKRIGELALSQIKLGKRFITSDEIIADLNRLTSRLAEAAHSENYDFRFEIVVDDSVNAFALPGGAVVINTGLLLKADSPEEVLGVLAHEISHVTAQHGMRQMISGIGIFALVQAFLGDATGIVAVLTQGGADLLLLRFSRDFEREADERGLQLLVDAGINPSGLLTFFEKLKAEEKTLGLSEDFADELDILSTHPATNERIERLEKALKKIKPRQWRPIDIDYVQFKEKLGAFKPTGAEGEADANQN